MSSFPRCLLYWVVHLTGVSTFKGFLSYRYTVFAPGKGVNITGVSTIQILCFRERCVNHTDQSVSGEPDRGVHLAGVSIKQNCTPDRDVHLPDWFVHLIGVSIFKRWLKYSCSPNRVWTFQGCHISHVHLTAGVPIIQSCAPSGMWMWKGCSPCRNVWQTWCQSPPKKVVHLIGLDTHLTRNVCS